MGLIGHNLPLIAWIVLAACGVVCAWALLWDRPRGRMRCRRCRYRMEGVPARDDGTFVCPECGREHANATSLVHAHRRWRLALACVLVGSVGWYGLSFYWRFRERGPMGYVPTTVLVMLPQSAEAWYEEEDGEGSESPIAKEMRYRTIETGMRLWQETTWVWNLRRHADRHSVRDDDGAWGWRFVRRADLGRRTWVRHRCAQSWCNSPISLHQRSKCPGDGALQLNGCFSRGDEFVDTAGWLVGLTEGEEVWDAWLMVDNSLGWPGNSAYAAYYTSTVINPIVEHGLAILRRPPGWRADRGRTKVQDLACTIEGSAGFVRRFDLSATTQALRDRTEDARTFDGDGLLIEWVLENCSICGLDERVAPKPSYPFAYGVYGTSLFIASTPEGLADAQRRLEDFHKRAPALWRELQDED